MTRYSVSCPSCASQAVRRIGAIPATNAFAGQFLEKEIDGGSLYECNTCCLLFRYPHRPSSELNALYHAGSDDNWIAPSGVRTDWQLIHGWLAGKTGIKSILDVGCYDGRLLESLGRDYLSYGIEIHPRAAERARSRGVDVLASDFTGLTTLPLIVDVAMAVDVIEHSVDPKAFLASLAAKVRPGGYVLVSTGNAEAPTWRLMGSRYWYCYIAEHISFISPSWARSVAPQLGLDLEEIHAFSHADDGRSPGRRIYEAVANVALRVVPGLFALVRRCGFGGIDLKRFPGQAYAPPSWMTSTDHMLFVFRKALSP